MIVALVSRRERVGIVFVQLMPPVQSEFLDQFDYSQRDGEHEETAERVSYQPEMRDKKRKNFFHVYNWF